MSKEIPDWHRGLSTEEIDSAVADAKRFYEEAHPQDDDQPDKRDEERLAKADYLMDQIKDR